MKMDDVDAVHRLAVKFVEMAAVAHHAAQEQMDHYETFKFYGRADAFQDAANAAYDVASELLKKYEQKSEALEKRDIKEPTKSRGFWGRLFGLGNY